MVSALLYLKQGLLHYQSILHYQPLLSVITVRYQPLLHYWWFITLPALIHLMGKIIMSSAFITSATIIIGCYYIIDLHHVIGKLLHYWLYYIKKHMELLCYQPLLHYLLLLLSWQVITLSVLQHYRPSICYWMLKQHNNVIVTWLATAKLLCFQLYCINKTHKMIKLSAIIMILASVIYLLIFYFFPCPYKVLHSCDISFCAMR